MEDRRHRGARRCRKRCISSRSPTIPRRAAIMWGPLVMAGDLGPEPARGRGAAPAATVDTPTLVTAEPQSRRLAEAGGRQARVIRQRRHRPRQGRRAHAVLPAAPPALRRVLRPLHAAGLGEEVRRGRRRARAGEAARGRDGRLPAARRDAAGARLQSAGREHDRRPAGAAHRPHRARLVFVRPARRCDAGRTCWS